MKDIKRRNSKDKRRKERDISSKTVFDNPVLCAQFLRDNVRVPLFQGIQPEDIEDVSERYRPYLGTEFASDTVKRIYLRDQKEEKYETLFVVSLIEHKSIVDYNVSMQLLRYMMCIWLEYGKEMEQEQPGITSRKSFRYPAIIPVVYYEGKASWTADRKLSSRICNEALYEKWVPDFSYEVIRIHDYSDEELLKRGNEMALVMLFNKIQSVEDLSEFLKLPSERLSYMIRDASENTVNLIASVMESLCMKIGATEEETEACVEKVKERKMGYLFENIEKMDIQAERRNTEEARMELAKEREKAEAERKQARAELAKEREKIKAERKQAQAELMRERKKAEEEKRQAQAELTREREKAEEEKRQAQAELTREREKAEEEKRQAQAELTREREKAEEEKRQAQAELTREREKAEEEKRQAQAELIREREKAEEEKRQAHAELTRAQNEVESVEEDKIKSVIEVCRDFGADRV